VGSQHERISGAQLVAPEIDDHVGRLDGVSVGDG
jgi:hypothetical protein